MATMTGWTWEQCRDQLDIPRVEALRAAWKDNPPLPITMRMAAEALGARFDGSSSASPSSSSAGIEIADPHAIMAQIGQAEPVPYIRPQLGLKGLTAETD